MTKPSKKIVKYAIEQLRNDEDPALGIYFKCTPDSALEHAVEVAYQIHEDVHKTAVQRNLTKKSQDFDHDTMLLAIAKCLEMIVG